MRYVPNVLLVKSQLGDYSDPESITTYKAPADCDPTRIDALSVLWSGIWHTLKRGISQDMRDDAFSATTTFLAWDVIECGDIELWPHPVEEHQVRISYTRSPNAYQDEAGCTDMDEQLLIMLTLDTAIPFYGRPDADMNNRHLNRHLGNIRAKQLHGKRFFMNTLGPKAGTPDHADIVYAYPRVT